MKVEFEVVQQRESEYEDNKIIRQKEDVYNLNEIQAIKNATQEHLIFIGLNNKNIIRLISILGIGTESQVQVDSKSILKSALINSCNKVILVHNHPSNITKPSKEDLEMTKTIYSLLNAFGIELLDHIVVSKSNYTSIMEEDELKKFDKKSYLNLIDKCDLICENSKLKMENYDLKEKLKKSQKNYTIYDGYKDEDKYRRELIKNIKSTEYKNLKNICSKLEYALSPYDLIRMATAYKSGDERLKAKIEYLLDDMNFHSECSELISNSADKVIENAKREIEHNIVFFLSHVFEAEYRKYPEEHGMIPANSTLLNEYTIYEIEYLIEKNILQKRDCDGLAYELTDEYIEKTNQKSNDEEEVI